MYEKNNSLSSFHFLKMHQEENGTIKKNLHQLKLLNHEKEIVPFAIFVIACVNSQHLYGPGSGDSVKPVRNYKNVIRYNLSGAVLFGFDKYIVFGYERVIKKNQTISVNIGGVKLPTLVTINTDSFSLKRDRKSDGMNASVDYRFYLGKENKYLAPHGAYIGPYYSYNKFTRDNQWVRKNSGGSSFLNSASTLKVSTVGFQFGYQFILWKRLSLDLVLVGPGLGFYSYKAKFDSNVNAGDKEQLLEGLKQLLVQKFPGMNYVFADKEFNANGVLTVSAVGYRYIMHIGFVF